MRPLPCTLCTLGDEPGCDACRADDPGGAPAPSIVYRIVHVPTGRWYVGKHLLPTGWLDPFLDDGYRGGGYRLKATLGKHPAEEFRKDVLAVCPTEEAALELEGGLVGPEAVANPNCLNLGAIDAHLKAIVGSPEWREANAARRRSQEARARASETSKAAWAGLTAEEHAARVEKLAAPLRTPEARAKRSEQRRAEWQRPEVRRARTEAQRRRYANETPEQKAARIAAVQEGKRRARAEREQQEKHQ